MKHQAYEIVKTLQEKGFESYWVGGCVRDMILHHEPKDYDIVTSARPEEVEEVFDDVRDVGKAFGVMLVMMDGEPYEVATFRSDGDYSDGRRPESVHFCSAEEDAKRRDFTINAIYYDPVKEVYKDFVQGRNDLRRGLLRFIGDPEERIREDHLRILRAIRFKNRFDLSYHKQTAKALELHSSLIVSVSVERILSELNGMLLHPHRRAAFEDLDRFGVGEMLLPEVWDLQKIAQPLDHHAEGNVFAHTLQVIDRFRPGISLEGVWAGLFHDIGKGPTMHYEGDRLRFLEHAQVGAKMVEEIAERLKFSKSMTKSVVWIVHHHHVFEQWDHVTKHNKLHYYDHPDFQDLLHVRRADLLGASEGNRGKGGKIERLKDGKMHLSKKEDEAEKITYHGMSSGKRYLVDQVEIIQREYYAAHEEGNVPSKILELLSGDEIMKLLKLEKGPKVGEIKKALREKQMNGEIRSREEAEVFVRKSIPTPSFIKEGDAE